MKLLAALLCLAVVPLLGSDYLTNLMVVVMLHAMPALGLALLMGHTGQISLGHAAFYGLGAYGTAALSVHAGVSPWLSIPVIVAVVGVVSSYLGWVIFRLRGHYLAVATLGLGVIVSIAFVELRQWTGGPNGLSGIPPLRILDFAFSSDTRFFYVAWVVLILLVVAAQNLVRAPIGLLMRGIAESERAVASVGSDVEALKRKILVISAVYAAIGGALYAHYVGYISPQPFGVDFSIRLVVIIAIGGFVSIPGVLFGVAFVTLIAEPLQDLGYYDVVVYGVLLVAIISFMPQGLLQAVFDASRRFVAAFALRRKPVRTTGAP
jgi:branched-chain amino acid transport system permease protein